MARRDRVARVTVRTYYGFLTAGPQLSEQMFFIEAANPGSAAATITALGFFAPDGRRLVSLVPFADVQFPHELKQGQSCKMWTPCDELRDTLSSSGYSQAVRLVPYATDAIGRDHRGPAISFGLEES